jgi:hypothetical protein
MPGTALVLRGAQGTGKSMVGGVLREIIGESLTLVLSKPGELVGEFNGAHEGKVLLLPEEAFFAGDRSTVGTLKHLLTSPLVTIRNLYKEPRQTRNFAHVLMTTNEDWAVPAGESERRFTVLDVKNERAHDPNYFDPIFAELRNGGYARLHHYLLHEVKIDWAFIGRPLRTEALMEQQLASLDGLGQWWLERLRTGQLPGGGSAPLAEDIYASVRESLGNKYEAARATQTRVGSFLKKLGVSKVRASSRDPGTRRFQFPPLAEARAAFAQRLAATPEWDEVSEWQEDLEALTPQ